MVNMGIGKIGMRMGRRRKWQWTFVGYDNKKTLLDRWITIIEPPGNKGPNTKFEFFPNMNNSFEFRKKDENEILWCAPHITHATIALSGATGEMLESWDLDVTDVEITEIDAESMVFSVTYGDAYYTCQ